MARPSRAPPHVNGRIMIIFPGVPRATGNPAGLVKKGCALSFRVGEFLPQKFWAIDMLTLTENFIGIGFNFTKSSGNIPVSRV